MLYRSLRLHQIFSSGTDCGKSILTTALCRTGLALGESVAYIKPIGTTGGQEDPGDDGHVAKFASPEGQARIPSNCLFRFDEPVSPHLAVQRAKQRGIAYKVPTDAEFVRRIQDQVRSLASKLPPNSAAYLESAGGVHSPTLSGSSQADAYRPLFLPTILVASHQLGGISASISAYESLLLRGYEIDAVLCFKEDYYNNHEYFSQWFSERGIPFGSVPPPPKRLSEPEAERESMHGYYDRLAKGSDALPSIVRALRAAHVRRLEDLDSAAERTLKTVWWPFVQHGLVKDPKDVTVVDSAYGDNFSIMSPSSPSDTKQEALMPAFDGSASWWTQTFGHAPSEVILSAAQAAGRYGHVLFPNSTNLPSLRLSEKLIETVGKGWASRCFYSDNGSTGMEVALKMALKASPVESDRLGVLGLWGNYHGDTIGAMDACSPNIFNEQVDWYTGKGVWVHPPTVRIEKGRTVIRFGDEEVKYSDDVDLGKVYDVNSRLGENPLVDRYRRHILETVRSQSDHDIAALLIEPILMGAGGMLFVDPLFQRLMIDMCRTGEISKGRRLPVVFDEVFVGLHRTGPLSTSSLLGVHPDIATYGKVLTGGIVPLSATLASKEIFQAFKSDRKVDALLHGHSYTAYPIACAAAEKSLRMMEDVKDSERWQTARKDWNVEGRSESAPFSLWSRECVLRLSRMDGVDGVMTLGSVLAVYLSDKYGGGYSSAASADVVARLRAADRSDLPCVHARPLGNVVYLMSSLNSSEESMRSVERALERAIGGA